MNKLELKFKDVRHKQTSNLQESQAKESKLSGNQIRQLPKNLDFRFSCDRCGSVDTILHWKRNEFSLKKCLGCKKEWEN